MKPKPISPIRRPTAPGPGSRAMPSASTTSAEPQRLVTARFPCLATGTPAPATTKAARVEMLKVPAPSAPVPHRSTAPSGAATGTARALMTRAKAASSSGVSPRTRSMASSAATWVAGAAPSMSSSIAASASGAGMTAPAATSSTAARTAGRCSPVSGFVAIGPSWLEQARTPPSRESEASFRGTTLVRTDALGPPLVGPVTGGPVPWLTGSIRRCDPCRLSPSRLALLVHHRVLVPVDADLRLGRHARRAPAHRSTEQPADRHVGADEEQGGHAAVDGDAHRRRHGAHEPLAGRGAPHAAHRLHPGRRQQEAQDGANDHAAHVASPADVRHDEGEDEQEDQVGADAGHHGPRFAAQDRVVAPRDHEQEAHQAEDGPRCAGGELGGVDQDGEHAATGGAQQKDRGELETPVHPLGDLPVQVEDVHVEGEVHRAEVEEGAGEDAPPLTAGDIEGVDEVLLAERPRAAAEETALQSPALAQDGVDQEEPDADADDPDGHVADVRSVGAASAVELAAGGEVVACLFEQPGDAVGDRAALGRGRPAIGLAVGGDRVLQVAIANLLLGGAAETEPRRRAAGGSGRPPGDEGA